MKNKLRTFALDCWNTLTEVPGWPDAPRKLRIRRLIPAVVPVVALASLFLWDQIHTLPQIRAERASFQPLLALEQEVDGLRLAGSDSAAAEAAAKAAEASGMLLASPKQLPLLLDEISTTARNRQWDAVFQVLPAAGDPRRQDDPLQFLVARGKLAPSPGNTQPFATLLALLDQVSPPNRVIDLTRLSVRADEQGRLSAEIMLRAGCRPAP